MAAKKSKKERMKEAASKKIDAANVVPSEEKEKVSVISQTSQSAICETMTTKDIVVVVLYSVLLFLAMTVQTGTMSMVLIVLALASLIGKKPLGNLRAHFSLPVIGLVAFAWMCGAASLYSRFGTTAAAELYKLMASFSMAVILLARFEKKHVRGLLWGFAAVCAAIALICLDSGCKGELFETFYALMEQLGASYAHVYEQTEYRNGIYNDANLTGALLGLAIIVSLYLAHTAKKLLGRFAALTLLGISAVSFLVALSRGAMVVFAVAVLVYLAVEPGKTRTSLFFLLLSAGVISACAGAVAMTRMEARSTVPILLALGCGTVAFAVDWLIGARLARALRGRGKLVATVSGVLIAALVFVTAVAFQITEPFVFTENSVWVRGAVLEPGEYTVLADWSGESDVQMIVYCQSDEEILLDRWNADYKGPLETAAFTVPENETWVSIRVHAEAGTQLNRIQLSDGTELPLTYTYLPEALVSRLQDGLLQGHNFQQRLQYFRDGLTLFKRNPLLGQGLGSTENLVATVQPFHYESLYMHNHVIQVMDEMGAVGLVAFLVMLLGSLLMLIQGRRKEKDPLAAALIGCWVMMNLHSLMEINFSIRMFQCAAFFVLMIPVLRYAEMKQQKWNKFFGYALLVAIALQLAVFGSLLHSHRAAQKEADALRTDNVAVFMSAMQRFAEKDPFDKVAYELNYVANAVMLDQPQYDDVMHQYVDELHKTGTFQTYMGLARHYYLAIEDWQETFACSRLAAAQVPTDREAWDIQIDFYRSEILPNMGAEDMPEFLEGISRFEAQLGKFNTERMEEVILSAESQAFLQRVNELGGSGCSNAEIYQELIALGA